MANSFEEMMQDAPSGKHTDESEDLLKAGDDCPEECKKSVHELSHERNSQLDTEAHPEAPETEIVCVHHGIVVSR